MMSRYETKEVQLPCPECGEAITFTLARVVERTYATQWRYVDHERWCGCQLEAFPDLPDHHQPLARLKDQAWSVANAPQEAA